MGVVGSHFELRMTDQLLLIGGRSIHIFHKGSKGVPTDVWGIDVSSVFFEWVEIQRL